MKYLILLFSLLLMAEDKKVSVEQLFSVQTVQVKKMTTSKVQKNYGYVKADESQRYNVVPRFGGYVEVLYADTIYKKVKKGELLVKVYSPEVLSAKEEYLATLKYDALRKNSEMLKSSRDKLLLLNIDESEIQAIEKSLQVSRSTNIYAPADGYIFAKSISNLDAFNPKQKLFEIVNLDTVWIEVRLHQKELKNLEALESFKVKAIGIEKVFYAKKGILYPNLNAKESTLTLRLHAQNKNNALQAGMYVSVEASGKKEEYLTLPANSVIRKNKAFYAFVAGEYEGEYEPREVSVKVLDANTYIIEDGLVEGDAVVSHAMFMMDSDAQINSLY
ncbi:efflux RND transporter periplasmic adaptor subunit [bacterium]|nr:efflux RND transporter periplasmic adaptor subunit [bacterium]MBU1995042.1 efflux RND transporter periplasmic adaptor subunit [bacterium]